jgi:hypothetical protein
LRYRSWTYEVRDDAIYLERGVLTRVRTVVPFVRRSSAPWGSDASSSTRRDRAGRT